MTRPPRQEIDRNCHLEWITNSMAYQTPQVQWRIHNGSPIILSWSGWIQIIILTPIYLGSMQILSSHLCLGLPKSLFSVGFLVNMLKTPILFSILATWYVHHNLVDFLTLIILLSERYKLWSFSLWILLHCQFSSLQGPIFAVSKYP